MTKQNLIISPLNLTPIESATELDHFIDAMPLVKRVNFLIKHLSDLGGEMPADKQARELSIHIKTLKEIRDHNTTIAKLQSSGKPKFTRQEEEAMAAELAELIVKNGGLI